MKPVRILYTLERSRLISSSFSSSWVVKYTGESFSGHFCFFKANLKVVNVKFILKNFSDRFIMMMIT